MIRILATLLAVLALAVAGCGSGDESTKNAGSGSGASGGGQQLALAAPEDGSLTFDPKELGAKAGTVTINFDNPSTAQHAVQIEGNGVDEASDTVAKDKTSVTADLKAGTYTFFCPVGDHRQQGMEGTLTVK
jgi:plastocyanin